MELIDRIEKDFKDCRDHTKDWRQEASKAYAYVSGDQWSETEKTILEGKKIPPIVFNKAEIFVSAVAGLEALNRQEVKFLQRQAGKASPYEILNAAVQYVNYDSDADSHHSHAFKDLVTCGMGWTDTYPQYETNPDGDIRIERIDPLEMYWDHKATQRCLSDAKWVARVKRNVSKEYIEEKWPDKVDDIVPGDSFGDDSYTSPHDASSAWKYQEDQARSQGKDGYTLVQYQWYKIGHLIAVAIPGQGIKHFSEEQWKSVKDFPELQNLKTVKIPQRRYRQAFVCGKTILEDEPLHSQKGFTLQCMTGKHDRNKNIWVGLMRSLFDPQDWTNKLFSQILHIINSNAKGGLVVEDTAISDRRKFEEDWAKTDSIVYVQDGAVSGNRIIPKPPPPYPQGSDKLLQIAISMFPEVSGINLELLGLVDKVQPGVLEAQRKQAGMTMLAWAFDAMRLYRKQHGRVLMDFIINFMSDGRLIRIGGPKDAQYVPLMKDQMMQEYDIIVDEAPTSPNQKERVFAMLTQLLPLLKDSGIKAIPDILEYSPFPEALVEKWVQALQPTPEQMQEAQMVKTIEFEGAKSKVEETKSKATLNLAKAQKEQVEAQLEPMKALG